MMTTAAHTGLGVTLSDPLADPYGSLARACFHWSNPSCDPCDPYQFNKSAGEQGQATGHQWGGQHGGWGSNIGVLWVTWVTNAVLSFVVSALCVTFAKGHRWHGSRHDHGGRLTALGSLSGVRGAGGAEPRRFPLHGKIEIENPFSAVGG